MNIRACRGGTSIFFCIVLGASITILMTYLQAADMKRQEFAVIRAMDLQIDAVLASYDPNYRDYGLFAFRPQAVSTTVFYSLVPGIDVASPTIHMIDPATETNQLETAIHRHMKGRLPAVYLDQISSRLLNAEASFGRDHKGLGSLLGSLANHQSTSILKQSSSHLSTAIENGLDDELASSARDAYQDYAAEMTGWNIQTDVANLFDTPDFMQPASISTFAEKLDVLLEFDTCAIYDKLSLVEYVLGYFRSGVDYRESESGKIALKNLNGKRFVSLPDIQRYDVEKIITGLSSGEVSSLAVNGFIGAFRGVIQLTYILTDHQQMEAIRTTAVVCSAAIAIISGGTVAVDSEVLAYFLAAGKAIACGMTEAEKLADGKAVRFWPGEVAVNPALYYQDYLRVILIALPDQMLIRSVGQCLEKSIGYKGYTGLVMTAAWHNRRLEWSGSYQ